MKVVKHVQVAAITVTLTVSLTVQRVIRLYKDVPNSNLNAQMFKIILFLSLI